MKKLSLALMLLGLSSTAAYAGGIDYQEPEESGVFMIGVELLYVEVCDSNFLYGYNDTTDTSGNRVFNAYSNDLDYDWAYHVDIAYAMPGDGPDISLGFTSVSTDGSSSKGGLTGTNFTGVNNNFTVNNVPSGVASGKTDYDYKDVDLVLGKEFVLQNRYHFHPFAGVRYGSIDATDKASYFLNNQLMATGKIDNSFSGVGPRAGIDGAMEIANGFSLVARAAGSVLIGSHDWKYYTTNTMNNGGPSTFLSKGDDDTVCVPEADYRLGLNYTYEFSPESSFGVELGWTAVHYFDVMDKSFDSIADTVGKSSDWGFQGPYLRLQANIA